MFYRAIFYSKNPDAARTKASVSKKGDEQQGKASDVKFPDEGWASERRALPNVNIDTVILHLCKTGKFINRDEVVISQKLLQRSHEFFFNTYVHDVQVATVDKRCYVRSVLGLAKRRQRNTPSH